MQRHRSAQRSRDAVRFLFGLDPAAGDAVIHPEQRIGELARDPGLGENRGTGFGWNECRLDGATEHLAEGGGDIVRAPVRGPRSSTIRLPVTSSLSRPAAVRPTSVVLTIGIFCEGSRKLGSTPSAVTAGATSPQVSTK